MAAPAAMADADAALATLVRLHEAHTTADSSNYSDQQDAERRAKAFDMISSVATASADGVKSALKARLRVETAAGRSAYSTDQSFHSTVAAVFWGLSGTVQPEQAEKLRATVFVNVLQLLHSSNATKIAEQVVKTLLKELHNLRIVDLAAAIAEVLRGVSISQRSQQRGDALAVFHTIELLPQLLLRVSLSMTLSFEVSQADSVIGDLSGPEYRKHIISKLAEYTWPRRFFLEVMRHFRDISLTQNEERVFCIKIYREARRELTQLSDQVRALETFPTVCLNVLQLVGRTENQLCRRLLTRLLINKWQQLTENGADRGDGDSVLRTGTVDLGERELQELQSTVLYHADSAMRQWDRLGHAIMVEYEQRVSLHKLSTFDIALLLVVASHNKYESMSIQFLLRYVTATYVTQQSHDGGDSGDRALRRKAFLLVVQHAHEGAWSPIIDAMITFSFRLIEHHAPRSGESESLTAAPATTPWTDLGVRLLLAIFQHHPSTRERILDRTVNMIVVQNADCATYVLLLGRIVKRHISELGGGYEMRLRECLEYVTHLNPPLAQRLLVAVTPLLKMQPNLKNFVILMLRKAMFRKDEDSRVIGIQGMSLLLCLSSRIFSRNRTLSQLYSQNVTRLSQAGGMALSGMIGIAADADGDLASQEAEHAQLAENLYRQFCGVFRRALELQTRVRLVLYAELVKVFTECPALQPPILALLFQHYLKYYDGNESVQPPLKLDLSLARKRGVYEEPLPHLLHTMLHCFATSDARARDEEEETMMDDEDVPATQVGAAAASTMEAMQHNFSVLFERLKRCELSDFEFDKNASFAADTELGETNRRLGQSVLRILQVAMNWTITQAQADARERGRSQRREADGCDINVESWELVLRYSEMYEWINGRLLARGDTTAKATGPKQSKKRKLSATSGKKDAMKAGIGSRGVTPEETDEAYEMNASLEWATPLAPSSLLAILEIACRKARPPATGGLPRLNANEEVLVITMLAKSWAMVDLIQAKQQREFPAFDDRRRRGKSELITGKFHEPQFLRRLCDAGLVLIRLYACNEEIALTAPPTGKRHGSASDETAKTTDRRRELVRLAVSVVSRVVEMWTRLPDEEFEEQLVRALCATRAQDSERDHSQDYDVGGDESDGLVLALPPLQKMIDELLAHALPDEAHQLLDVVQLVCARIPVAPPRTTSWAQELLVAQPSQTSTKVMEKLIAVLLRPQPASAIQYDLAQRLAQGLRRQCNSGSDNTTQEEEAAMAHATGPPIEFRRLSDKQLITAVSAILTKVESEVAEMERHLKVYDASQRRQTVKFKEDDLAALHQLEEETGSQVFSEENGGTAQSHAVFKRICQRLVDVTRCVRPFVVMALRNQAASVRILRLAGRVCKLLTLLVKDKLRRKDSTLPRFLRLLFDRTAADLSPAMLTYISCIHNDSRASTESSASKKKQAGRSSKFVPEVVYQLEQYDLALIKLSKLCKGHDFTPWCRLRDSRDFRLNQERIKRSFDEAGVKKKQQDSASDAETETATEVPSTANGHEDEEDTESADEEDMDEETTSERSAGHVGKRMRSDSAVSDHDHDGEDEGDDEDKGNGEDTAVDDNEDDDDDEESAVY